MRGKAAIILSSGGLDSTTCLAIARAEGFGPIHSLSFDYGQRHRFELNAARRIAQVHEVKEHRVIQIDLRQFGKSALTDEIAVPKDRSEKAMGEVRGVHDVFIGVNAIDYSGYPDCRPEFIEAFERMANLATKMTTTGEVFRVHTPLIHLTK